MRSRDARLAIETESVTSLTLRSARTLTLFDRHSRAVTQNDRQVAPFGSIRARMFTEQD